MWVQIAMMVAALVMQERQASQERKHKKKAQALEEQIRQEDEARQKSIKAREEESALKKRQAKIRAQMSAGGIGMGGGSSDAILAGMQEETRQNLLDFNSGFATENEKTLEQMKNSDGVSEGLKNAQTALGYTDKFMKQDWEGMAANG